MFGGRDRKELIDQYGGFHDVESYRRETGDNQTTEADINSMLIADYPNVQHAREQEAAELAAAQRQLQAANTQAQEEKRRADAERSRADNASREAASREAASREAASREAASRDNRYDRFNYGELEFERARRRLAENALYPRYDALNAARFIEKERLKDEIKRELDDIKPIINIIQKRPAAKTTAKKQPTKPAAKKPATKSTTKPATKSAKKPATKSTAKPAKKQVKK